MNIHARESSSGSTTASNGLDKRLQVPGMLALSPSMRKHSALFVMNSPTASPRKIPTEVINTPSPPPLSLDHSASETPQSASTLTPTSSASNVFTPGSKRKGTIMSDDGIELKLKPLVQRRLVTVKFDDAQVALSQFSLGVTLGTGTFGRVNLIREKGEKQQYFALKTMKKCDIVRLKQVDHIISESSLLKELCHPFIVNLCCSFQDKRRLYLILEYVPGGELFSYLRREKRIPDDYARFYASELVLALDYLHQRGIAYRDLKPENLLLSRTGHLKITDFGFAKKVDGRTWTLCGTPEYLAPEIIQSRGHGKGVDWWALGILLFEMLAGYPPFYDDSPLAIYQKILRGTIDWPGYFDSRVQLLISRLLKADVSQRLGCLRNGAEDVANESWFARINWQSVLDRLIPAPFFPPVAHPGDASNFDEYDEEREADPVALVKPEEEARFLCFGPYREESDRQVFMKDLLNRHESASHTSTKNVSPTKPGQTMYLRPHGT